MPKARTVDFMIYARQLQDDCEYVVVFLNDPVAQANKYASLRLASDSDVHYGMCRHEEAVPSAALGEVRMLHELPDGCQRVIMAEVNEYTRVYRRLTANTRYVSV